MTKTSVPSDKKYLSLVLRIWESESIEYPAYNNGILLLEYEKVKEIES